MKNKLNKYLIACCFVLFIASCKKEDVSPDRRYIYYNSSGADVGFVVCNTDNVVEDSVVIKNGLSYGGRRLDLFYKVKLYFNNELAEVYGPYNLSEKPKDPRNYGNYEIVDTDSRVFYYFYTFLEPDYQRFLDSKTSD